MRHLTIVGTIAATAWVEMSKSRVAPDFIT